jgi:hypothetical protein
MADGLTLVFIAGVVQGIAGERQETDSGEKKGSVPSIFPRVPGTADVSDEQHAEQEHKCHGTESVKGNQPGFKLTQACRGLANLVQVVNPPPGNA